MPDSGRFLKLNSVKSKDELPATSLSKKAVIPRLSHKMAGPATVLLIVVIFSLTVFTLWVAFNNYQAVQQVQKSSRLNNLFEYAHYAVGEVESLERKYRLEPGPAVKSLHMAAALDLIATLNQVRTIGNAADQAVVDEVVAVTQSYLDSIERMFAAIDINNSTLATKIDNEETDPLFTRIAGAVSQAATDHAVQAQNSLTALADTQRLIFVVTPIVFFLGLTLIIIFGLLLRTYRRQMLRDKVVNEGLQVANLSITRALEKEKELNELKTRFVTMASHEFRTPLTAILSSSELLEAYDHKWTAAKKHELFGRINTAVANMTELLDGILVIDKAEEGHREFKPTLFDLVGFCRNLAGELQPGDANKPRIKFFTEHSEIMGWLDQELLRQILVNLLSNAIKYSPRTSTIDFELCLEDGQIVFQVKDRGIGIPAADQPRLFENFHRAANVGTISGTGLGLALVKKAVDLHRGQITFSSLPGAGTSFRVSLPLEVAPLSPFHKAVSKESYKV